MSACLRAYAPASLRVCAPAHLLRACESSRLYYDLQDPRHYVKVFVQRGAPGSAVAFAREARDTSGGSSGGQSPESRPFRSRRAHEFHYAPFTYPTPPHTQTLYPRLPPPHTRSTSCCLLRHFHVSLLRQHVTGAHDTLVARVASSFVTSTKHSDHMLLALLRITRANNRPPIRGRKR